MSWRTIKLSFVLCLGFFLNTATNVSASELNKTIDLWMNDAPLTHVIHQLAELSGGKANITGALEGQVSGRFYGTVAQTLQTLSQEHDVLFDLQDDILHATSNRALSEVSIVMPGAALNDTLRSSMQSTLMPGNNIDVQDELVKLSGHPDFVKRTARLLAAELAMIHENETKAVDSVETVEAPEQVEDDLKIEEAATESILKDESTDVADQVVEPVKPVDQVVALEESPAAAEPVEDSAPLVVAVETEKPGVDVNDIGSDAVLADIADEAESEPNEVKTTDSIQWVTDIPGFSTF